MDKNKLGMLIVGKLKEKMGNSEKEDPQPGSEEKEMVAQDLMKAFKSGNVKELAVALSAFIKICEAGY